MATEFPVIFLLPTHLQADELHKLEEVIPTLTYDANEAEVVLGKISSKQRALFELRHLKILTEDLDVTERRASSPAAKRRKAPQTEEEGTLSDSSIDGELESREDAPQGRPKDTVKVVKLNWFTDSTAKGAVLPIRDYLIYEGRKVRGAPPKSLPKAADILERAKKDPGGSQPAYHVYSHGHVRKDGFHKSMPLKAPALLHQPTWEHDADVNLPPIPDFLHTTYSCQRSTPVNPPNGAFIEELTKIRTTRLLIGDKIGVRAYSTSIATLAAYPYTLTTTFEVARLPGCGPKIAELYQEYRETGKLTEALDAEADPKLSVLKLFYDIWGVAETTARDFHNKGWRDLDDIVEYGWDTLSRVQQIGVKYYDEFQLKIPRSEVELIANTILDHARKVREGFEMVIVGGYRRGKEQSGDVDVILSHRDHRGTQGFIEEIVVSLERDKFITHTLTLSTANTERGQTPVSWKGNEKKGSGFDTLDKALVVWQNPDWTPASDVKRNPNPHRRVDIIISPWRTVGCAVLGWTSGTTFQRDLRRYCKRERALKFDSSGIRSRVDGAWVDLEDGGQGPAPDMLVAERRVFAGLELEWRPPEERCTG